MLARIKAIFISSMSSWVYESAVHTFQ